LFDTIIEPFAGAAGYSTRFWRKNVVLVDLANDIYQIWDWLIHVSEEEFMRLPTDFSHLDDLTIPDIWRLYLSYNVASGQCKPQFRATKFSKDNLRGSPETSSTLSKETRSRRANQLQHIRHWQVYHASYDQIDFGRATWFVDPPYNNEAGSRYTCNEVDFSHLSNWCKAREGQVIVCENDGADWLPFVPLASIGGGHRHTASKEVFYHQFDGKDVTLNDFSNVS